MTGPEAPQPVCPRHPDRVSYVRCQRCDRPVCHECQVPAAVGVQCVDCVREQRRSAPLPRTTVGAGLTVRRPLLTYGLLGLLVVMFVLQLATSDAITTRLSFVPALSRAEPWRFFTVSLLHSTAFFAHLLFNAVALWSVGREAERLMGRVRYVAVLLLTTLGGSVAILWLTPVSSSGWLGQTVGISGTIFGLFGAALALEWRSGRPVIRQFAVILAFALIGLLPGLSWSWQAHVGGLASGILAGLVLVTAPRERRTAWQAGGFALLAAMLVVLVLLRWATVPASLLA